MRTLSLQELRARIPPVEFTQHDPYYHQTKTYLALPLAPVLQAGFEGRDIVLEAQHFVLRARDGYTVPLEGKRLVEDGGHIAIDDLDVADGWQPIGKQEADPGPFYLVWSGDDQLDLTVHPRPWQLAEIEVSRFESSFPKVVPEGAGEAAQRGFAIFREQCIRCHAINQQGGKVGPELNVPQSIVEYRDPALLKRYIKNPSSFRYGNMPDNPPLPAGNLDDLIAYFTAMSERKDDPKRGDARGAGH